MALRALFMGSLTVVAAVEVATGAAGPAAVARELVVEAEGIVLQVNQPTKERMLFRIPDPVVVAAVPTVGGEVREAQVL